MIGLTGLSGYRDPRRRIELWRTRGVGGGNCMADKRVQHWSMIYWCVQPGITRCYICWVVGNPPHLLKWEYNPIRKNARLVKVLNKIEIRLHHSLYTGKPIQQKTTNNIFLTPMRANL